MSETHTNLTGHWLGRFDYDHRGRPASFDAQLTETGSTLDGQSTEPNGFRKDMGPELTARLSGGRTGSLVSFVKRYEGFEQGDVLVYDGAVNAELSRIEGRWRFPSQPGWGGRFVMFREARQKRKAKRHEAETIDI